MDRVSLGCTGLDVSRLCFGTMGIGNRAWRPWVLDETDAVPLLRRCLDVGITFFDLADWYSSGESERIVGKALLSMVPRGRLVLTTKAHYALSDDPNDGGLSRKHLLVAIDRSLKRIGTDHVDMFMVHAFDPTTPMEETMATLHEIVQAGKARYLGASTMWAWQFAQMNAVARENGWTPFVNMECQYNLLYREEEREMLPFCRHEGIAVTASSVLARGQFSGSGTRTDTHSGNMYGDALDREICGRVHAIAKAHDTTMAAVAIAWVLSRDDICCPIIGANTANQVASNVGALDLALTAEETAGLDALYRPRDVINQPKPMPRYWQEESDG